MTKLSAEAYAIVEGRHSDPFHYLGLHTEGGKTVVRAFLPEASKVDAIGEHGETASLTRILARHSLLIKSAAIAFLHEDDLGSRSNLRPYEAVAAFLGCWRA